MDRVASKGNSFRTRSMRNSKVATPQLPLLLSNVGRACNVFISFDQIGTYVSRLGAFGLYDFGISGVCYLLSRSHLTFYFSLNSQFVIKLRGGRERCYVRNLHEIAAGFRSPISHIVLLEGA